MKTGKMICVMVLLLLLLTACSEQFTAMQAPIAAPYTDATQILLSDDGITVDGVAIGKTAEAAVYAANDIIYYEAGRDFTYGEGSGLDAHTPQEAAAHTVVHITAPGAYCLSGKLSAGQIAVDLGENAPNDPQAKVILIMNGVDITCTVAPGVIFYNVYECGSDDPEKATKNVSTASAGANVILADGTVNCVTGSYVAKIYRPETVELNKDNTKVKDAKKLHKYDGAFYSRQSINIFGGKAGTGVLNIIAENEGLDSEMHLTVNGGHIHIESGNDGINTNADGVSVTTINGGNLQIRVTGESGEGDGIDSNGWIVIRGGSVNAAACATSADSGIDSDMGIHITGGTVIATGNMLDRLEDGGQNYAVFQFAQAAYGEVMLKNKKGVVVLHTATENSYSILLYSSPELKAGSYTLWRGTQQLAYGGGGMENPAMNPGGMHPPQPPQGMPPEGEKPLEGEKPPAMPGGERPEKPGNKEPFTGTLSFDFAILRGGNHFSGIVLP